jgi:hypothetical protein
VVCMYVCVVWKGCCYCFGASDAGGAAVSDATAVVFLVRRGKDGGCLQ